MYLINLFNKSMSKAKKRIYGFRIKREMTLIHHLLNLKFKIIKNQQIKIKNNLIFSKKLKN